MIVRGDNLEMTRGDTEQLTVSREDEAGTQIDFVAGDVVYFTVKTSVNVTDIILQKTITTFTDGKAIIEIEPADTSSLSYGTYRYDVQLTELGGDVTTLIRPAAFKISGEVTYD